MKRLFILATAATVALASCTKTQVVYNEAPEEIGFKAITGVMTKAVDQWDTANDVMGLYAYEAGTTTEHLENVMFKKDGESFVGWSGSAHLPYYWPLGKNLDFVVYAPHAVSADYNPATKVLTYPVDNSGDDQIDVLYGAKMLANSPKSPNAYSVDMKHALAWIQVNIKADQAGVLKVNSFSLTDIVKTATMNVNYTNADEPALSWTNPSTAAPLALLSGDTSIGTEYTSVNFLILPAADQTAFAMSYDLGTNTGKRWDKDITGDWKAGYKYVYNIEVGASEIKINPTVDSWEDNVETDDFAVEQE